jgi:hypothetical protein
MKSAICLAPGSRKIDEWSPVIGTISNRPVMKRRQPCASSRSQLRGSAVAVNRTTRSSYGGHHNRSWRLADGRGSPRDSGGPRGARPRRHRDDPMRVLTVRCYRLNVCKYCAVTGSRSACACRSASGRNRRKSCASDGTDWPTSLEARTCAGDSRASRSR